MSDRLTAWETDRSCIGTPLSTWFAPPTGVKGRVGNMLRYYDEARRICAGCPCLTECEDRMFASGEVRDGFAAGMTSLERQRHPRWRNRDARYVNIPAQSERATA